MTENRSNVLEVLVTELCGIDRKHEFVRIGVPCPKGALLDTAGLQLLSPENESQQLQSQILKKWQDGSVKWLLIDFAATVPANSNRLYRLIEQNDSTKSELRPIQITKGSDHWRVSTGAAEFVIDIREYRPFRSIIVGNEELLTGDGSFCLFGADGKNLKPIIETIEVESEGPIRSILRIEGRFESERRNSPRYVSRIHFFADSSYIQLEITLQNPGAASHPGGLWDLGDSGSLLFKEFSLVFPLNPSGTSRIHCSPEPDLSAFEFDVSSGGMRIYQESSGGHNWDSPVHRTRDGNVRLRFSGYEITRGGETVATGKRATPIVWYDNGDAGVSVAMPCFWQEFPKAFSIDKDDLKVEFFPGCSPDLHELQGGEQKTNSLCLDFAACPETLAWVRAPLIAVPSPETSHNSGVFIDLPYLHGDKNVTDLVDRFVTADDLYKKREVVDEYGWRNFGDLYADHEAVYHKGTTPFVSHYNNQYDGVGGTYRKFFATGDPKWGEIASALARHVQDIDSYHTDNDREEYNRGLFWHTDHYIDAGLSTHRSCSKEHLAVKDPRFCGGGPAAEHCYTTGLMYHYFQTGNPVFREAVIDQADWGLRSLSGPMTVLAVLKRSVGYIQKLRNAGNTLKTLFPKYPLTRGTGNVLTACLDAYEVSGDNRFISKAEELIRGALHPEDDIDARNLLNAEIAWSYTVLLNAVAKFIYKKHELEQHDAGYHYAKASLLAYAEWMLVNEYPYLEKPQILEYPNETWAAQDLRKSVIFYHAAHFCAAVRVNAYLEHARYFFNAAADELQRHKTSTLTRPVVLMLQNGWVGSKLVSLESIVSFNINDDEQSVPGSPTPSLTFSSVFLRITSELLSALRQTSFKRELSWLKARM
ncbi:hypothetical protein OR1_02876 [Geobacter sp. OR-1]|uniref:RIFT barrel domain-containing protein n=1 Tax=Geobacter sp. OR-1 TaxID=1266765 RepID=UPI000543BBEC|nr:hypothetical protein [Geobacter sp. OR-1]GAM10587.1 hypothetical protein OR1_02876 [Geobacter sp. OR-1]